jgi:hypothetical protein
MGARHQLNPSLTFSLKAFSIGVNARVSSGALFTPMVSGDVNGDGSSNDRAFVFDPETVPDTAIASAMSALLTSAPDVARRCLRAQLGSVAARGSCSGPWTATLNFNFTLNPVKFRLPRRTTASINFNNPLALVDMLVNGSGSTSSMGQQYNPDPTLLYVRGFDATNRRFRYEVNPRFGDTRAARAGDPKPFLITLSFRTELGPEVALQNLRRTITGWRAGTTRKPTEQQLRQQYANPFLSPFQNIIRQRDSLRLTTEQGDSIRSLQAAYAARIDSIWVPLAKDLAQLPDNSDIEEVFRRIRGAQRESYDLQMFHGPAVKRVLTRDQLRRLPASLTRALDEKQILEAARNAGVR